VTGLKASQIVEIGPSSAFPDGYLGTVLSARTQGGFFVVATHQASLDNVYSTYQSAMNIPFVAASMNSSLPGVRLDRPTSRGLRRAEPRGTSRAGVPARDRKAARCPGRRWLPMRQAMTLTFSAWGPFWPWVMSNSTFCPSSRLR
jgi:hypothetical protein